MACKTKIRRPRKLPIGGIISTGASVLGQATEAEKIRATGPGNVNPGGTFKNKGKVENAYALESFLTPWKTLQDPNATSLEKFTNLAAPGLLGNVSLAHNRLGWFKGFKSRADRAEESQQKAARAQYRQQYDTSLQPGGGFNQVSNIPLMPLGGLVPYDEETVELENGEPFKTPDGQISKISNQAPTHAQGGVPITLPSGTKVLGKKPATDEKTFKELGSKLERQQSKYQKILDNNPTRLAEQTANRMLDKIDVQFNELFDLQGEDTQSNQQFPNGGTVGAGSDFNENYGYTPEQIRNAKIGEPVSQQALRDPNTGKIVAYEQYQKGVAGPQYIPVTQTIDQTIDTNNLIPVDELNNSDVDEFATGGYVGFGQDSDYSFGISDSYDPTLQYAPQLQDYSSSLQYNPRVGGRQSFTPYDIEQPQLQQDNTIPQKRGFNASNILSTAASLAPVAYNLYQGMQKPNQVATNAFRNPYESEVRATMRGRRYNIQPELEAARLGEATYYRNLREGAPTQAQYLGGLQAGNIATQRALGQTLARKQNIDNQYLAEQARTDLALGQADVQRQQYIEDINARSAAAQRQFTSTGLSQLGQFAQVRQQQNNQMIRDAQRLNLLPALVQNFTLNDQGQWVFKQTGEVVDDTIAWDYVTGQNR